MITENDFRKNFGKKLNMLRKQRGLTQNELALELNYSDKAVSKWERGESVPDSYTLYIIADFFGVSIDDLLSDRDKIEMGEFKQLTVKTSTKLFVPIISVIGVLFIASVVFLVLKNIPACSDFAQYAYIYSLPVASVVLTVFSSIWWKTVYRCISVSLVIWTSALSLYLSLNLENLKYIFISCAFLQLATIIIYIFADFINRKNSEKSL